MKMNSYTLRIIFAQAPWRAPHFPPVLANVVRVVSVLNWDLVDQIPTQPQNSLDDLGSAMVFCPAYLIGVW